MNNETENDNQSLTSVNRLYNNDNENEHEAAASSDSDDEHHYEMPIDPRETSALQAFFDRTAGHALFNTVTPSTLLATLKQYRPDVVQSIVEFIGSSNLKYLALLNLTLAFGASLVETAVRRLCGTSKKEDPRIHTPLPATRDFSRLEAGTIIFISLILQTLQASSNEYCPDSELAEVLNAMHDNPLYTLIGQFIYGIAVGYADEITNHNISQSFESLATQAYKILKHLWDRTSTVLKSHHEAYRRIHGLPSDHSTSDNISPPSP